MAMNPMQKKARTSFLLGMFLTLVITGIIIGVLIFLLVQEKKKETAIIYKQVYVTSQSVISGGNISESVTLKKMDSSIVPADAITTFNSDIYLTEKATAKIGLEAGTVLTTNMVNADGQVLTSDLRLQEYNMVILPTYIKVGDFIDIRLRLPSGEDYIVLSKKYVERTDVNTIWIKVGEDEILTMSSAIVEAYIMNGSLLYANTYTDAGIQSAATPTYVVKNSVINLMNSDPGITAAAKTALVARYSDSARAQRDVINKAVDSFSETALDSIQQKLQEEIQKQQAARQEYISSLSVDDE